MAPQNGKGKTEETFETGLEKLKAIVDSLEKSDIGLDEALDGFEEGIRLSRKLSDKLSQAEARLERLTRSAEGQPVSTPLSEEDLLPPEEGEDEDE
ncbi:MAG: exodeoxyribonuclease VII small subunit [Deltaproteobacteria bacterium]|jgi:exodeoxyribonuclease VII small subunit|nr:exodeoxyribonuclease VII small subunit [Deltaproteobacteria bacterium]